MSVVFWVGTDVLEDHRACRSHNEHLQHEVIERLEENLAEGLGLDRGPVVVSKVLGTRWEIVALQALLEINFKLVTDAFDTYTKKDPLKPVEGGKQHLPPRFSAVLMSSSNVLLL